MFWLCALVVAFWGAPEVEPPMASVAVAPDGSTFADWAADGDAAAEPDCSWWNGTVQYDTGFCSTFAVTRVSAAILAQATDRANRCAAKGTTDCVLSGEIGLALPSVFLYDESDATMRMIIAPRLLPTASEAKTIKLVDPYGEAPNQLFEFNNTVTVEYLKGGARTMEVETLTGHDAYCVQSLRRSIAPTCWAALD